MKDSANECYEVKSGEYLINYLKKFDGRMPFDCDYQLKTNLGLIHELRNGEVIFLSSNLGYDGIVFKNKACFQATIAADAFPIENPHRGLFEFEKERIRNINLHIDYYRQHLNSVFKLDFHEINRESVQAYLKKIVGRAIRKLTTEKDAIALVAVVGQLIINELGGSWLIEKRYGTYNPYYEPLLLNSDRQVILLSSIVMGKIKWKLASVDDLFNNHLMRNPIDYAFYSEYHSCIELE